MDFDHLTKNKQWNSAKKTRSFVSEACSANQPTTCSWCGEPIAPAYFVAFAPKTPAAMCGHCIERYAVISRLGILHRMYGDQTAFETLREAMIKESSAESSEPDIEQTVISIAFQLACRSSSILNGFKSGYKADPNYGYDLGRCRFALVGCHAKTALAAVRRALRVAGLLVVNACPGDCRSGMAQEVVRQEAMGDPLLCEHVVIAVHDGYSFCDTDSPVIYVLENESDADELPEDVKVVYLG